MSKKGAPPEGRGREEATLSERVDLRAELEGLDRMLGDLKIQYEQYFAGLHPLPPDKEHNEVKRKMRQLRKAPFKNSALNYQLRTIEVRYGTLNTYWQRVLREREAGTYVKDVFKANLRERIATEEAYRQTAEGAADSGMRTLFDAYRGALEKQSGRAAKVDFDAFKDSLLKRARDFKEQHGDKKLTFKVVVKDGKVTVKATAKRAEDKPAGAPQ